MVKHQGELLLEIQRSVTKLTGQIQSGSGTNKVPVQVLPKLPVWNASSLETLNKNIVDIAGYKQQLVS